MSVISRINYIRTHRVFENWVWSPDLADFGQFNLIYGWNGSGKSTLSNLLRLLEKKEALREGEAEFLIQGKRLSLGSVQKDSVLPQVRVFNKQFISASVFVSETAASDLAPIFFLGEDSVEKEKRVEKLTAELMNRNGLLLAAQERINKGKRELDTFCIDHAKTIKALLRSSGDNPYNDYDKKLFKKSVSALSGQEGKSTGRLSDEEYTKMVRQKDAQSKPAIRKIVVGDPDLKVLLSRSQGLLKQTAISRTIAALVKNRAVASWVAQGVPLHTGEHASETCRFCDQLFPKNRLRDLQDHFNDHYKKLLEGIDSESAHVTSEVGKLKSQSFPGRTAFYEHLTESYDQIIIRWNAFLTETEDFSAKLLAALADKKQLVFEEVGLNDDSVKLPDWQKASAILEEMNKLLAQHNEQTAGFESNVSAARARLEEHEVAGCVGEHKNKIAEIEKEEAGLAEQKKKIRGLNQEIEALKRQIEEHRRPAEQLNDELKSYLGHDHLQFQIKEAGYVLTRDGIPALNLSEGEKTAIAFLYFLKSLEDVGFKATSGVVVIDDPVSSLDSNSLFSAFSYMKESTKQVGQLFILTHNFALFRQIKNWFSFMNRRKQNSANFYMVKTFIVDNRRSSRLTPLDSLLRNFESEYHFIFKQVYDAANATGDRPLEEYYLYPNLARRLLESFLAFRYPRVGELYAKMQFSNFDDAKRTKLVRFLHTYSHSVSIEEQQHDPTMLAETPAILKDLMNFIKVEDGKHYDEMVKVIAPTA